MHAQLLRLFVTTAPRNRSVSPYLTLAGVGGRGSGGARRRSRSHFNGVGHLGASCGVFTSSPAEGVQIGPEQEVAPLAVGDAQSPQRALDPRPLGDAPAVSGGVPQKLQKRMRGGALAARGLDREGGEVIAGCVSVLLLSVGGPAFLLMDCVLTPRCAASKRRSSWACIGNPNPEQETIEGTHAQETPAYQRRPTTLHAAQGNNPPIRALYM